MLLADLMSGRCPWCRRGRIFRGVLAMNRSCPSCGTLFEKEPGYFVGAMYFSYFLAVPAYALLAMISLRWLGNRSELLAFGAAILVFLPLIPLIFRASRVIWLYFDFLLQKRLH
jgi:uncharacterized protein (DUF983 family)